MGNLVKALVRATGGTQYLADIKIKELDGVIVSGVIVEGSLVVDEENTVQPKGAEKRYSILEEEDSFPVTCPGSLVETLGIKYFVAVRMDGGWRLLPEVITIDKVEFFRKDILRIGNIASEDKDVGVFMVSRDLDTYVMPDTSGVEHRLCIDAYREIFIDDEEDLD